MCQSFRFLSWLKAFLGSSPSLPICTLPGFQVIFPKSRLDPVSLWLRRLLRTDRPPVVWRPESRLSSITFKAPHSLALVISELYLSSWFPFHTVPPNETTLGSLNRPGCFIPSSLISSSLAGIPHLTSTHSTF